eukprot:COSAG01_NODE_49373_length_372_cov_4.043956_1_plen_79_part_01
MTDLMHLSTVPIRRRSSLLDGAPRTHQMKDIHERWAAAAGAARRAGEGRGRRHARPPYRAEVLTLDPLPRRSAPARSEH